MEPPKCFHCLRRTLPFDSSCCISCRCCCYSSFCCCSCCCPRASPSSCFYCCCCCCSSFLRRAGGVQRYACQAAALADPLWPIPGGVVPGHAVPHKLGVALLLDGLPDLARQPLQQQHRGALA